MSTVSLTLTLRPFKSGTQVQLALAFILFPKKYFPSLVYVLMANDYQSKEKWITKHSAFFIIFNTTAISRETLITVWETPQPPR
jgi:hypothetical protein